MSALMHRYRTVSAILQEEAARPYAWGTADCFQLACRVADALDEGLDLTWLYDRAYTTAIGAQRALRRRGARSLEELLKRHFEAVAPARCRPGDLGIVRLADGDHVGVATGRGFAVKRPRGLTHHEAAEAVAAFRVGAG